MIWLILTPAVLSLLVLGAHYLREGQLVMCGLFVVNALTLLFVRNRWYPRLTQLVLGLGLIVWALALRDFMHERQASGEPVTRLVVIMGAVMAVDVLAIVLLGTARVRAHFTPKPVDVPAA